MSEVTMYKPEELSSDQWLELQTLQRDTFSAELNATRTQEEIDHLVRWGSHNRYVSSHVDPNSEVGKSLNPNQEFFSPRIAIATAVATKGSEIIGFGYASDNVSGETERIRTIKRFMTSKRYLWFREIAVKPDYQRRKIGAQIVGALLREVDIRQPVTAYIWPDEISFLEPTLSSLSFSSTGEQQVEVFGENTKPTRQVRMLASSTGEVLSRLARTNRL
jgi:GNAT superfamily N-acetyltransferase